MKKLLAAALSLLFMVSTAAAMTRAGAPAKFAVPFANSAASVSSPAGAAPGSATYPLPTNSQVGITNCAASLQTGMPPLTMTSVAGGGCAPYGQDINGILKQMSQWNQQTQAGAIPAWDSTYNSNIGGYPEGSIVSQASTPYCFWISQVDNNTSDPDTGGANWTSSCPGGGIGLSPSTEIGGNPNQQAVTTTPFIQNANACIVWQAGYTNTSSLQINVNGIGLQNVYSRNGLGALVGTEVVANEVQVTCWDGTQWELFSPASSASLVRQDQTLVGGANVTSNNLGTITTGTLTIDCGKGPLQYLTDGGTFTIAAPARDGSCMILITNTTGAQIPSFSGFTVNSNTGEPFTTTSGNKFMVTILEINGVATWVNKSLQ